MLGIKINIKTPHTFSRRSAIPHLPAGEGLIHSEKIRGRQKQKI
jgi:hypothetical protein